MLPATSCGEFPTVRETVILIRSLTPPQAAGNEVIRRIMRSLFSSKSGKSKTKLNNIRAMRKSMFYESLRHKFLRLTEQNLLLDHEITIRTHILKPSEAIGNPDRKDFPLLKGKEVLMQATFLGMKGQAYTDE
ncbi:MAG: hypothetical protein JW724_01300, partial [Candidatus Altiarchaeota archaeon]|nr:hypothetical protein [Candidatus Altiarchaeota archaeon]